MASDIWLRTTQIVKGNPLPPHGLRFPINSKGLFICTIPDRIAHTTVALSCFVLYLTKIFLSKICILHCLVLLNSVLFKPCLFRSTVSNHKPNYVCENIIVQPNGKICQRLPTKDQTSSVCSPLLDSVPNQSISAIKGGCFDTVVITFPIVCDCLYGICVVVSVSSSLNLSWHYSLFYCWNT